MRITRGRQGQASAGNTPVVGRGKSQFDGVNRDFSVIWRIRLDGSAILSELERDSIFRFKMHDSIRCANISVPNREDM